MHRLLTSIMQSRWRASAISTVMAPTIFFWLSGGIIALVTLSKGPREGFICLLWASLPCILVIFLGGGPFALLCLFSVWVMAALYIYTASWEVSLFYSIAIGLVQIIVLYFFAAEYTAQMNTLIEEWQSKLLANEMHVWDNPVFERKDIAAILGVAGGYIATLMYIIGQYWYSLLYKPRNFARKMNSLILSQRNALGTLIATAVLFWVNWDVVAHLTIIPLVVAGIGLMHAVVFIKGMSTLWLVIFYAFLILFAPAKFILASVAAVDSVFNFRQRLLDMIDR